MQNDKNTDGPQTDEEVEAGQEHETVEIDAETALVNALAAVEAQKDLALRAQAEMENIRRRSKRDVENAHKYATDKMVVSLLTVVDSLEKAVEIASKATEDDAKAIAEGVELSLKLFIDTLEKEGVTQIDPHGEPFDPELHEAMSMVEAPDAEPNSVIEVFQKGYRLNGRLVRAAMVMVAKAGAEPANKEG